MKRLLMIAALMLPLASCATMQELSKKECEGLNLGNYILDSIGQRTYIRGVSRASGFQGLSKIHEL